MSDEEIMRALVCCNAGYNACGECPLKGTEYCERHIIENAYDLIKRQQAEIERLESIISTDNQMIKSLNKCYEISKSEAIKEFAERLGNYKEYRYNENCDFVPYVRLSDIEKVVYEMVGTENESNE